MKQRDTVMVYAGLINALIDHIDNDFRKSPFNNMALKNKSNSVLKELLKLEDLIFSWKGDVPENSFDIVDQYVNAGSAMIKYFRLGLEMADMDESKCDLLSCDLNILLKKHGIDFKFE